MDGGALDDALERRCRHGFGAVDIGYQVGQVFFDEFQQGLAQVLDIHGTGLHHAGRVRFIDQGQQQMLQRCEFMAARIGQSQGRVNSLFKRVRE